MQVDGGDPDWGAIGRDYDAPGLTVDAVCARHGISTSRLYRRIARDGWIMRSTRTGASRARARAPAAMLVRLGNIISRRIRELEEVDADRIRGETALESERQARAIAALLRAIDHLVTMDDRLRDRLERADNRNEPDTDAWSADLAEALAALTARHTGSGQPEDAATGCVEIDEMGADGPAGPASADRAYRR